MTQSPDPRPPRSMQEVNATLHQLDGATLEWWGFSVSLGRCVWKVTGLRQGVGYIFMLATRYINFPSLMRDVRLRAATAAETDDLRSHFPSEEGKWLREQDYHIVECAEGQFSVWSNSLAILWGEAEAAQFLWEK